MPLRTNRRAVLLIQIKSQAGTRVFAIDLKPNWVQFTAASPFIGTKLRDWAVAHGLATEDEYAYVNSHQVWIGNENLSKEQVKTLYRFARFFQTFLLNRKGLLKQDHPLGAYRFIKSAADLSSDWLARTIFRFGSQWLRRAMPQTEPG